MLVRWRNRAVAGACAAGLGLLLLAVFAVPTLAVEPAVEMYHAVLVGGQPGELNVSERIIFSGLEGRKTPLEIPLPAGAIDVRIADGTLKGEVREGKVVLPGPFTGEKPDLALSYRLISSTSPHFDLSRTFPWPVKNFVLLTPQADLAVSGPKVSPAGDFPMGGTNYRAFLAENIPAKEKLELLVTLGVVTAGQGRGEARAGFWQQLPLGKATPYLFAAVVAVVAVALVLSRRGVRTAAGRLEAEENAFHRLRAEEQVLLRRLQELEEKYSQQKIDKDTYERLQEEYKSRLIKVRADLRHLT